jgi:hypothetical protein
MNLIVLLKKQVGRDHHHYHCISAYYEMKKNTLVTIK